MSQPAQRLYKFGPYRLDPVQQLLSEGSKKIPLTPKAFQTLLVLVEAQGRVVAKDELLQKVWPDTFVEEATLAQNVFTLRKQLQDDRGEAIYIETVPKRGYRFVAKVRVEEATAAEYERPGPIAGLPAQYRARTWTRYVGFIGAAALIASLGLGMYRLANSRKQNPPKSERTMLVVLPVKNLTGDAGQEYLVDGLTEEVIAELGGANPQRLGVIARTSAMAYKDSKKTVQDIARELGVDYVLESSVRESAGNMRFTAQLIRTQDQTHVWAHNYDHPLSDALSLQDELAKAVAEQIQIELPQETAVRLSSPHAVKPEAYEAYLKGRFFWNQRTPAAMTIAEKYFRQAIDADPKFAPAYAGLADCYQVMINLEQIDAEEGFSRARQAALKALELDSGLAEAHTSLASIKGDFDWDWQGAETEYKRALQLNPNYATAHHWYGDFLAGLGRFQESETEIQKAREVDPLAPVLDVTLAQLYCRTGRCQQAVEQLKKTLQTYPDFAEAHEALAEMYAYLGMYEESVAELAKEPQAPKGHAGLLSGYAAARAGHKPEALQVLRKLEGDSNLKHRDYYLAVMYAAVGDKDQAFAGLEKARQSHDPHMPYFRADSMLQELESDPRYAELCRRMKMDR